MDATIVTCKELISTATRIFKASLASPNENRPRAIVVAGPPGVGKTELAKVIQKNIGFAHRFMIKPGHHDALDFNGLPAADLDTQTAHFLPFGTLLPPSDLTGGCLLVGDEFGDSERPVQNIWRQLVNEGGLHNYRLPKNTLHWITTNRLSDRSGANRIITKFGNVVAWYTLKPTVDEVFEHLVGKGGNPTVLAFLKLVGNEQLNPNDRTKDGREPPTYFNTFDPSDPAQMITPVFASSRSIEYVSNHMNYIDAYEPNLDDGALLTDVASMVGTPWATKFVGFRSEALVMPDPEAILRGDKVAFPKKESVLWCLTLSLVAKGNKNSWKYIDRFLKQGPAEYRILCVRLVFDQCIAKYAGDDFNKTLQEADIQQALKAK